MFGSPEDMKTSSSYSPLLGDHGYSIYYLFIKKVVEKQKIGAATLCYFASAKGVFRVRGRM